MENEIHYLLLLSKSVNNYQVFIESSIYNIINEIFFILFLKKDCSFAVLKILSN